MVSFFNSQIGRLVIGQVKDIKHGYATIVAQNNFQYRVHVSLIEVIQ